MVDSINPNAIAAGGFVEAAGGNESLDQEAFLKLFVAQLRNQDPLDPQDNHEFIAQLAQFSSLEQTVGINDRLDQLSLQNRGLQNSETVSLVGKQVEVRGNIVTLSDQDTALPITYGLEGDAEQSTVLITNASGDVVRTIDHGDRSQGGHTAIWNGFTDSGLRAPSGAYSVSVVATDENEARVTVNQNSEGVVDAVSFEQGFPILHLDSGLSVPIADLLRVSPSPKPVEE